MRKLVTAALTGATIAGGALIAQAASAQPYGYYPPASGYGYSQPGYGGRYYDPYARGYDPYARGYDPYARPSYYQYGGGSAGNALSVLGAVLGLNYPQSFYSGVPVDRYGPDPNGMIGPDGRRIKCKLRRTYDSYYGGSMVRRECWSR